jgi:hypothetical protein
LLDSPSEPKPDRMGHRVEHNAQKLKIARCVAIAHKRATAPRNP